MKKSITVFLIILLLFSFTACSKSPENVQQTENQPQTEATTEAEQQNTEEEKDMQKIIIEISGKTFTATLYDNETARALTQLLPLTLNMSELNGNEKYHYLDNSLPTDPQRPSGIKTGDIMLYGDSCIVLFYKSFSTSYSYTPIGHIDDAGALFEALGKASATVTFRKGK